MFLTGEKMNPKMTVSMFHESGYVYRFGKEVYQKTFSKENREYVTNNDFIRWVYQELGERPSSEHHLLLTGDRQKPVRWGTIENPRELYKRVLVAPGR